MMVIATYVLARPCGRAKVCWKCENTFTIRTCRALHCPSAPASTICLRPVSHHAYDCEICEPAKAVRVTGFDVNSIVDPPPEDHILLPDGGVCSWSKTLDPVEGTGLVNSAASCFLPIPTRTIVRHRIVLTVAFSNVDLSFHWEMRYLSTITHYSLEDHPECIRFPGDDGIQVGEAIFGSSSIETTEPFERVGCSDFSLILKFPTGPDMTLTFIDLSGE